MDYGKAVWLCVLVCLVQSSPVKEDQKVILILVDGCRWDYVDDPALKGFPEMAKKGAKAKYVVPVFPSNSYPNWYSIVTGLYSESHGFVQNVMYDQVTKEFFLMFPNPGALDPRWWNKAEPIWVTAEKNGIRTGMYWWVGCEVEIRGRTPTECVEHIYGPGGDNETQSVIDKFEEILNKFQNNTLRLAQVYYGSVDYTGHNNGPDSSERKRALYGIDKALMELQKMIEDRKLEDQVNVVVVSDHGMTPTDPNSVKYINLEDYVDPEDVQYILYKGSSSMILPQQGKEDMLYNKLKNASIEGLTVYKKEDIPEDYHFKNNELVLPLFLLAHKGYYIKTISDSEKTKDNSTIVYNGNHGYDPKEVENMNTIFYARGPAVKEGYEVPYLTNVDHYNLLCHMLGMDPLPNNGSLDRVRGMMTGGCKTVVPSTTILALLLLTLCLYH